MNKDHQFLASQKASLAKWLAKIQPSTQTGAKDIRIGIWGTSGSGKTTYLAMLYYSLLLSKDWQVTADSEARQFVTESVKEIKAGKFPPATQMTNDLNIFTYTLARQNSSAITGPKIALNFIDAPGEFYEDIHSTSVKIAKSPIHVASADTQVSQNHTYSMGIMDYLISCDGIIFLLDPTRSNEDGSLYWRLLFDLFMEFQERSQHENMTDARLQQYMAFCVTKVDKPEIWSRGKESADLAKDVMGQSLFTSLETGFCLENRYKFYSISSIGRYFDKESKSWKEAIIYPDNLDSSKASNIQTNASSPPSPRRRHSQDRSQNSQAADALSGDPNAAPSPSPSPEDDWSLLSHESNISHPPSVPLPTINTKVQYEPFNVLTPIEWLVNSIQKHPPSRTKPKQQR